MIILPILQWLQNDFLSYLEEWDRCVAERTDLSAAEKKRCCLSRETIQGLQISGNSL